MANSKLYSSHLPLLNFCILWWQHGIGDVCREAAMRLMTTIGVCILALYAMDMHFFDGAYSHALEAITHQLVYGY